MTYPNYPGSGVGNEVTLLNGQDVNHTFTPQTTGNVYVSFLVNVVATSTNGDYFIHFGAETIGSGFVGRVFAKKESDASNKIAFGIQLNSGGTIVPTYSEFNYDLNTTYLIVLKHDNVGKVSSIVINPAMNIEPTTGWVNDSQGTNAMPANIGAIGLRQPSPSTALNLKLDGIRVATSWASLFTTTGTSNPSANSFNAYMVGKNLTVTNTTAKTVDIYSALGAKVQTLELVNGTADMSNFSKGLYIVRVGKQTAKIMLK